MTAHTFVFRGDRQDELEIGICAEAWKLLYRQSLHCSGGEGSNRTNESAMVVVICPIESNQRTVWRSLFEKIDIHGDTHPHSVGEAAQ